MKWLTSTYRTMADHLTKILGGIGATFMSLVAFLDPTVIREAAQTYLGQNAVAKIGTILFVLVILRGIYTGMKAKKAEEKAALAPVSDPK